MPKCQFCPVLDAHGFPAQRETMFVNEFNDRACDRHITKLWQATAYQHAKRMHGADQWT